MRLCVRRSRGMSDYLPEEVLFDIFSRLSLKTLLQIRLVCKLWHSTISKPSFIALHTKCTNQNHTLFLRHYSGKDILDGKEHYLLLNNDQTAGVQSEKLHFPFKSKPNHPFRMVGSCNGVICLLNDLGDGIILWNPSIRKFRMLPRPCVTHLTHGKCTSFLGFGFDHKSNDYKVVRLVYIKGRNGGDLIPPEVEVFGVNSGSWRRLNNVPPYGISNTLFTTSPPFQNGALYWIGYDPCKGDHSQKLIFLFDLCDEEFKEFRLPNGLAEWKEDLYVVENGLSLSIFKMKLQGKNLRFNVWTMSNYGSVTNIYSLDMCEGLYRPIGFNSHGDILFVTVRGKLVLQDINSSQGKGFGIRGATKSFYVGTYIESLALLDGETVVQGADAVICDAGDELQETPQSPRSNNK